MTLRRSSSKAEGIIGEDRVAPAERGARPSPGKIWQARDAPTAQALRASLCGLFATSIAQEDAPDGATVSAALARTKATANADLPLSRAGRAHGQA